MNILCVGSSVIDLFLKIEDISHIEVVDKKITLSLGDKIPISIEKIALGGNASNVAVGLKRLSHNSTLFTYLGEDLFSKEIEEGIKKEGIEIITEKNPEQKSSLSFILHTNNDRIIFSHHDKRKYGFYYNKEALPDFIYLTSIGKEWEDAYRQVLEFVKSNNIPLCFTPGSYQFEERNDVFFEVLKYSKIILVNREEAIKILQWKNINIDEDIKNLLSNVKNLGPQIVSITDGKKGAYAVDENNMFYGIHSFRDEKEFVEKTGAGDAYTSGFLAKYFIDAKLNDAMIWGSINAYSGMKKMGAQDGILTLEQMEKMVSENPGFKAEKI